MSKQKKIAYSFKKDLFSSTGKVYPIGLGCDLMTSDRIYNFLLAR